MPGRIPSMDIMGVKIVSVFPYNAQQGKPSIPAMVLLMDGATGEVISLLEGGELTRLRTGAASGAATDLLAVHNASVGAILGTGGQGPAQLEAMVTVRNMKKIRIFDPQKERGEHFIKTMSQKPFTASVELVVARNPQEAVSGADIITTATTSHTPVFEALHVKKGAHVNAVGSYQPQAQEIDPALLKRAHRIFLDSREAVLEESGDFIIPIEQGLFDAHKITGEIGMLVSNPSMGRQNPQEVTVFKTVGLAVQDLLTAWAVYKKAKENGVGRDMALS